MRKMCLEETVFKIYNIPHGEKGNNTVWVTERVTFQ